MGGEWIYQLDKPLDHSESNGIITDEIIIWHRDAEGRLSNIINDVFIHDSMPELVDFEISSINLHTAVGTTAINWEALSFREGRRLRGIPHACGGVSVGVFLPPNAFSL